MNYVMPMLKATIAGIGAGISVLIGATLDGSGITLNEWLVSGGAAITLWNTTFFIPYSPLPTRETTNDKP